MEHDKKKIEEVVLALLYYGAYKQNAPIWRSWKSFDWDILDSLCKKGYISDPAKKHSRSVALFDEGYETGKEYFEKYFGKTK